MDLSQLTDAELTTLKTNLLASINNTATGGQAEKIGEASRTYASLSEVRQLLSDVNREIRQRADTTGGVIYAEFGEPL